MRKGITPIIAIIVLLLITVALAGAAWTYLSTYMAGLTGQSVEVRDYFCINDDTAIILITNTGTIPMPIDDIKIINTSDGSDVTTAGSAQFEDVTGTTTYSSGDKIAIGDTIRWKSDPNCLTQESCIFRVIGGTARAQIARILC